jgi:isoleucyl-tRNA synthetase
MLTNGSPWASRRIGHDALDDVLRRFLLTLWNVYAFFVTYANAEDFDPRAEPAPQLAERPMLDRWVSSRLARTVRTAREGLEAYDATGAGRAIQAFVDDLSNWYVRRSRRRFWDPSGAGAEDARSAFHTLHESLVTVSQLLAPFTPFVSEALWRNLAAGRGGEPDSVHLSDYPEAAVDALDERLEDAMAAARAIVELGRRVRVETKTRTRQPLAEAVVHLAGDHRGLEPLLNVVADELNVKHVGFAESVREVGRWRAKPNYKALGPRLGGAVKDVASALQADDGSLAETFARGGSAEVRGVPLGPDDVDLTQEIREGWGVASEGGLTVALDLELTQDLRREGIARELVRLVQDARKAAGLHVSDRIVVGVETSGEVASALATHREHLASETLAREVLDGPAEGATPQTAEIDGTAVSITVSKV